MATKRAHACGETASNGEDHDDGGEHIIISTATAKKCRIGVVSDKEVAHHVRFDEIVDAPCNGAPAPAAAAVPRAPFFLDSAPKTIQPLKAVGGIVVRRTNWIEAQRRALPIASTRTALLAHVKANPTVIGT